MLDFTVFCMCKQKNTNMPHDKDIAKIQEIKTLFKDSGLKQIFSQINLTFSILLKHPKYFQLSSGVVFQYGILLTSFSFAFYKYD
jgi:hypothetical protein